jgi:hypothetical protein
MGSGDKMKELETEMVQIIYGKGRKPEKENLRAHPIKTQINPPCWVNITTLGLKTNTNNLRQKNN